MPRYPSSYAYENEPNPQPPNPLTPFPRCFSTSSTACATKACRSRIQEWQTFLDALEQGLHGSSLLRFYHLGRACLIKSETYFDAYDRVFARVFKGVEGALGDDVTEKVLEWLQDPKNFPKLSPEELAELERLTSDELMRRFLETLAEQTERHDGGDKWVGTGGTLAVRPRRPAPHRHPRRRPGEEPLGDEGGRGAPLHGLPHRRRPSTSARCGSRCAACAS